MEKQQETVWRVEILYFVEVAEDGTGKAYEYMCATVE